MHFRCREVPKWRCGKVFPKSVKHSLGLMHSHNTLERFVNHTCFVEFWISFSFVCFCSLKSKRADAFTQYSWKVRKSHQFCGILNFVLVCLFLQFEIEKTLTPKETLDKVVEYKSKTKKSVRNDFTLSKLQKIYAPTPQPEQPGPSNCDLTSWREMLKAKKNAQDIKKDLKRRHVQMN